MMKQKLHILLLLVILVSCNSCQEVNSIEKLQDEEFLEYIFEKFFQSQHQNTIKPEGSGLGLAITKQIVEKHNGNIWAKKELKNGAKLVFTIPIL